MNVGSKETDIAGATIYKVRYGQEQATLTLRLIFEAGLGRTKVP